jgi:hypothetical protein
MRQLLLSFVVLFLPLTSFASGMQWPITDMPRFWLLGESRTHVSVDDVFLQTKGNYDLDGKSYSLQNESSVSYNLIRGHIAHGFSPRLSFFGQVDGRLVFIQKNPLAPSTRSNFGAGDVSLAARYLLYKNRSSNRLFPTEWSPNSFVLVAEGSWVLPTYNRAALSDPPLGDQSNDFTGLARFAWYTNDLLAISGGVGYTYRTNGYEAAIPWNVRTDFSLLGNHTLRLFADLDSTEPVKKATAVNFSARDFFPNSSLLFKSDSPALRTLRLGMGYQAAKDWEISGALFSSVSGQTSAKGLGGALGLTWRPYQAAETHYDSYEKAQLNRRSVERSAFLNRKVIQYGLSATVIKVSRRGNFFKIAYGSGHGIHAGDAFEVFPPDDFSGEPRKPIAAARVVVAKANESFLRVEKKMNTSDGELQAGCEARRVTISE